jgi:hypothetical protein
MRRGARTAILTGLMLLTVFAYAPGTRGEFVLDDQITVESNRGIRNLGQFPGQADWSSILTSNRVFTEFTFALDYAIGKVDPLPFHATNLAIHLAMVLLIYAFVRKLLDLSGLDEKDNVALAVAGLVALLLVGLVQAEAVDTASAVDAFERARKLEPDLWKGRLYLAAVYRAQGRTQEACAVLRVLRQSGAEQLPEEAKSALASCPFD